MCREAEKSMRQARKREILNFIDGLQQAHGEIREALEKHELSSVQTMLAECQEFAVELGNAIEETEGEECVTVSHVEEYCETLFRVFESMSSNVEESSAERTNAACEPNKVYKLLKKQLLRVENSVKNDIPVRREIAFFPYKAAMWDSLESVYLAAKEDPDCDAYCVPIPYFDLNDDHSFGLMHYEGNEYPQNIEITDWQTYQLEERKPDMIFIHNPYDEWNHVTSVHPRYYAKNLKQYTDQLVYIPYFILEEITSDDLERQRKIDSMKHFCFLPGTIYADKVVVQSEAMRQIYIEEYLKEAKQANFPASRLELEKKILGVGSPKIDKVVNAVKAESNIPEDWMRIIGKPNGELKKVIFYNISISTFLHYNEKWIEKVENTLRIFRENQEEVALLWRPHPLIENTMKSMRPGMVERYREIRDRYIEEAWGIYDDTPDLDRAIAISDAYYGDRSSVVQLYQQTGKPVMIQNIEVLN